MFKIIAIRIGADGKRYQNEWMRGIQTVAEAQDYHKQMVGRDGITDGYLLREDEPLLVMDDRTEAERLADFHAAMADKALAQRQRATTIEEYQNADKRRDRALDDWAQAVAFGNADLEDKFDALMAT